MNPEVTAEVVRLEREFAVWRLRRQIKDEQLVASILKSWGIQVGRA